MNKSEAYSTCRNYMNQYVNFKTADGGTYQGYIGNVDRDMVYVQVPEKSARKLESSESSRGGCRRPCYPVAPICCLPCRPPYPVSPAYFPPYPPRPFPVSPATAGPRPQFPVSPATAARPPVPAPVPAPVPVPVPYPGRRGWCWIGIPLAFLAGLWLGSCHR